jgi:hypothetical protein
MGAGASVTWDIKKSLHPERIGRPYGLESILSAV